MQKRCLEAVQVESQDLQGWGGHVQGLRKQEQREGTKETAGLIWGLDKVFERHLCHPCASPVPPRGEIKPSRPAEGPGLLPTTCTPCPARHCFLLRCLRAVGRNRPVWTAAGYPAPARCLPLHPQPRRGGLAPHRSPRPPTRPRVGPGSPHGRALQGCDQLQQRARDSSSGEAKGSHE